MTRETSCVKDLMCFCRITSHVDKPQSNCPVAVGCTLKAHKKKQRNKANDDAVESTCCTWTNFRKSVTVSLTSGFMDDDLLLLPDKSANFTILLQFYCIGLLRTWVIWLQFGYISEVDGLLQAREPHTCNQIISTSSMSVLTLYRNMGVIR